MVWGACDSLHWPTPVWLDVYAGRIILYLVEGEVTASSPSVTVLDALNLHSEKQQANLKLMATSGAFEASTPLIKPR